MVHRILILNPNSNQSMTDSLRAPIESLNYNDTEYTYLTGPPTSPASINNLHDADLSTTACLPLFTSPPSPSPPPHQNPHDPSQEQQQIQKPYAAILVACFSPHPLVPALISLATSPTNPHTHPSITPITYITDIFAASVGVACQLLSTTRSPIPSLSLQSPTANPPTKPPKFGIISTGAQWRRILSTAILHAPGEVGRGEALGCELAGVVFGGVETVGMDAGDLHPSDSPSPSQIKNPMDGEGGEGEGDGGETIKQKVQAATARLLHDGDKNVEVVVLGCAGMVGMEGWVREEISREVEGGGGKVKVLDGVKAGVGVLQGLVRGGY